MPPSRTRTGPDGGPARHQLQAVVARFLGPAVSARIAPLGRGLINATYRIDTARGRFVLQRINAAVFPAPERIMANLARLQAFTAAHPEFGVRPPGLIPATDGRAFVRDADDGVWRLLDYVHPSRTLNSVQNRAQAAAIGRVLGRFHCLSAALDPADLEITLPGFHHTPSCLAALDAALDATPVAAADAIPVAKPVAIPATPRAAGAAASRGAAPPRSQPAQIEAALEFIADRRQLVTMLDDALRQGRTRMRVTHGDPKLDNLLFAPDSDQALCLIDLDTVQPGLIHHDIGDCLRSCCNRVGESPAGEAAACFDLDVCDGILAAYAEQTRHLFSAAELGLIYPAIRLIPFELGLRFLTDHLQGDRYFRVDVPGANLRKARVQFALTADIERKAEAIAASIRRRFGADPPP